jgi:hypothetical protein
MGKMTKTLLGLSLVGILAGLVFTAGLVNAVNSALYTVLPLGAVFFGLFLISMVLEKESALYDQEQRAALEAASACGEAKEDCGCSSKYGSHALETADVK